MPVGPGKYDDVCSVAKDATEAEGVILIVFNGSKGHGFSVQADLLTLLQMPDILRKTAAEIESSFTELRSVFTEGEA